jgi:hypothetical protein
VPRLRRPLSRALLVVAPLAVPTPLSM